MEDAGTQSEEVPMVPESGAEVGNVQVFQESNTQQKTIRSSNQVPPRCNALDGKDKDDFISFKEGFLKQLDCFEELNEDWDGEREEELFTGNMKSAMAWQVLSNWEQMSDNPRTHKQEMAQPWEVMPENASPIVYNIQVPNYDVLNKFTPHDPKKKRG